MASFLRKFSTTASTGGALLVSSLLVSNYNVDTETPLETSRSNVFVSNALAGTHWRGISVLIMLSSTWQSRANPLDALSSNCTTTLFLGPQGTLGSSVLVRTDLVTRIPGSSEFPVLPFLRLPICLLLSSRIIPNFMLQGGQFLLQTHTPVLDVPYINQGISLDTTAPAESQSMGKSLQVKTATLCLCLFVY